MAAGAAEAVIEIEMAKGGIEIIHPHQTDDTTSQPDAFRIPGGTIDRLGGLTEFGGFPLILLGRVGRGIGGGLAGGIIALGKGAAQSEQKEQAGECEGAHNRHLSLNHPSTHEFPDGLRA